MQAALSDSKTAQQTSGLTFGLLLDLLEPFIIPIIGGWFFLMVATSGYLVYSGSPFAFPFIVSTIGISIPFWVWKNATHRGLPYMIIHVLIQGVFILIPMFISNRAIMEYSPDIVSKASLSVSIYFAAIAIGWKFAFSASASQPAKWSILGENSEKASDLAMRIAATLLIIGLVGQILPFLINLGTLNSVLVSLTNTAAALGAFLGGYAQGIERRIRPVFWLAIAMIFLISIHDVLISASSQFILAAILGLALGSRKIPWTLLLVVVSVVSFLNLGKFVMRERYWKALGANITGVSLTGLPSLYSEWIQASLGEMSGATDQSIKTTLQVEQVKKGDFSQRINGFETPLFVTRAVTEQGIPLLYGATYTLIPPLLLPRFLWPNKPRAHASQDLLNFHFQRQREVDIERTFIAWGFLPEGIGNFGGWLGPLVIGLVIGAITGRLEAWSLAKDLFSVEGFVALGLLLKALTSYEVASSIFITSTFQMVMVSLAGGFMIRNIFAGGGAAPPLVPMHD